MSILPKIKVALVSLSIALTSVSSFANDKDIQAFFEQKAVYDQRLAHELAPVKSNEDLNVIMSSSSKLDHLSDYGKSRFVKSMVFSDKGLASFSYAELEAELTPTQIYEIMSLFGLQRLVPMMSGARIETSADALIMAGDRYNSFSSKNNSKSSYSWDWPKSTNKDYNDKYCAERATCRDEQGAICTSNC